MVDNDQIRTEESRPTATPMLPDLRLLTPALIAIGVGLYVLGLLIVNLNLGRRGYVVLDLARPEYVMAGALWAFLTVTLWSIFAVVSARLRDHFSRGMIARKLAAAAGTLVIGLCSVFFVLNPLSRGSFDPAKPGAWFAIGVMSMNSFFLAESIASVSHLVRSGDRSIRALFRVREFGAWTPTAACLMLVTAIAFYAESVFPRLPREIGGGSKPSVQVTLRSPISLGPRPLDLPLSSDGKSIGPVLLLVRTTSTLVLQLPPDSPEAGWNPRSWFRRSPIHPVVEIPADLTLTVQYAPCCP